MSALRAQVGRYRLPLLATLASLVVIALYHQSPTFSSNRSSGAWILDPSIAGIINEHIELQGQSYAGPTPVTFAFDADGTSSRGTCAELESLRRAVAGRAWSRVAWGRRFAAQCGTEVAADNSHSLFLSDVAGLEGLAQVAPTCRDCSSTLIVAYSPAEAELETAMDSLLDGNFAWTILRDLQPLAEGFVFALRRQPIPLQEQRHMEDFIALQAAEHDVPCEEGKFIVNELMPSGLGSVIATISRLSYFAVHVKRPLILIPNANFAYLPPSYCPDESLNCYFHSPFYRPHRCLSYVQTLIASKPPLSPAKATSLKSLDPTAHSDSDQLWLMEWPSWTGMTEQFYNHLRAFDLNPLATRSFLLLTNPRRPIRQLLATRLATIEPSPRYISLHVRHGDKSQEYPLIPFETYMSTVDQLAASSSIKDIYLATDNSSIITHELQKYPHLHFITQAMERHGDEAGGKGGYWRTGFLTEQLDLFLTSMVDLEMLSRAEVFVGSESSGFTHLVKARRAAEGRFRTWGLLASGKVLEEELGAEWIDEGVM